MEPAATPVAIRMRRSVPKKETPMLPTTLRRHTGRLVLAALIVAPAVAHSALHADGQQATVSGRVTDRSGAALPGATVVLTNSQTGIKTQVVSNVEGLYTIPLVPPGRYSLSVELSGFRPETRTGIVLDVQQVARFD